MTNTDQTRISKAMNSVLRNLNQDSIDKVKTYLENSGTPENLNNLCIDLKGQLASNNIAVSTAIEQILQICDNIKVGDTEFYHSDRSHSFYTCESPNASPVLLFTTTADLSSFEAARNTCYRWASTTNDLYGSTSNSCAGLLPLDTLALPTCLAAMDYPVL